MYDRSLGDQDNAGQMTKTISFEEAALLYMNLVVRHRAAIIEYLHWWVVALVMSNVTLNVTMLDMIENVSVCSKETRKGRNKSTYTQPQKFVGTARAYIDNVALNAGLEFLTYLTQIDKRKSLGIYLLTPFQVSLNFEFRETMLSSDRPV